MPGIDCEGVITQRKKQQEEVRKTTGKCVSLWSMIASQSGREFAEFYSSRNPTTTGEWALAVKLASLSFGETASQDRLCRHLI